jgi:hypothetical protein
MEFMRSQLEAFGKQANIAFSLVASHKVIPRWN